MQKALPIYLQSRRKSNTNGYVRNVGMLSMTSKSTNHIVKSSNDLILAKTHHDKKLWVDIHSLLHQLRNWYNEAVQIRNEPYNNNNNNARSMNTILNAVDEKIETHWEVGVRILDRLFVLWQKLQNVSTTSKKLHRMLMECQKVFAMEPYDNAIRDALYNPDARRHVGMNNARAPVEERLAWRLEKALMSNFVLV
jgi:hypothetical protein